MRPRHALELVYTYMVQYTVPLLINLFLSDNLFYLVLPDDLTRS